MSLGQLYQPLLTVTSWFTWPVWFLDIILIFALNSGGSYTGYRTLEIRFLLLFFLWKACLLQLPSGFCWGCLELVNMSFYVLNKVSLFGTVAWWDQHGGGGSLLVPWWWVTIPRNRSHSGIWHRISTCLSLWL